MIYYLLHNTLLMVFCVATRIIPLYGESVLFILKNSSKVQGLQPTPGWGAGAQRGAAKRKGGLIVCAGIIAARYRYRRPPVQNH